MKELIGDFEQFIMQAGDALQQLAIQRDEVAMMDHLCYRVQTEARYQEMKQALQNHGTLIGENIVNGRPIAVFELHSYMKAEGWTVPFLELPSPKAGSLYAEGLEHAEFVVVGSLSRFAARHQQVLVAPDGVQKAINPDIKAASGAVAIKFHEQQLGAVVRIEHDVLGGESR